MPAQQQQCPGAANRQTAGRPTAKHARKPRPPNVFWHVVLITRNTAKQYEYSHSLVVVYDISNTQQQCCCCCCRNPHAIEILAGSKK